MPNHDQFDVIIIGTGAGGGTQAYCLAPSGKRILLLERGDFVPREKDNWHPRAVNVDGKYQTKEVWKDRDGKDLHPHTNYCVGGNTKFYGAALFRLTSEDLPDANNRVTLDRDGNIVLTYEPNNVEGHRRLTAKLEELLNSQRSCGIHGNGCHQGLFARNLFIGERIALAGVAHQNGTIRFGHDSKTSALDVNCRTHDVDNLYVVDSSFFPSSGAVNPGLTIMANALRVGEHLVQRLG